MVKTIIICDCCQKDVSDGDFRSSEICVHVTPSFNFLDGLVKVIDGKTYSISSRTVSHQFCIPCYNELYQAFFDKVSEIKSRTVKS